MCTVISSNFAVENGLPGYCKAIPYVCICNKCYSKKRDLSRNLPLLGKRRCINLIKVECVLWGGTARLILTDLTEKGLLDLHSVSAKNKQGSLFFYSYSHCSFPLLYGAPPGTKDIIYVQGRLWGPPSALHFPFNQKILNQELIFMCSPWNTLTPLFGTFSPDMTQCKCTEIQTFPGRGASEMLVGATNPWGSSCRDLGPRNKQSFSILIQVPFHCFVTCISLVSVHSNRGRLQERRTDFLNTEVFMLQLVTTI